MTRSEFLTLQLAALDALERKELCCGSTDFYGRRCAFLVLKDSRQSRDRYYPFHLAVIKENDRLITESPAARFVRVRAWVAAQLGGESL